MAKISTMIQLNDAVSGTLQHINNALNMTISSFERLDSAADVNFGAVRQEVAEANAGLQRMQQQLQENNQVVEQQSSHFSGLTSKVMGLVGAYAGLQGLKNVIGLSDELTLTTARLDLMNDGLQSTEELQQKIFQSAQDSRGAYQSTADAISKMGLLAGDAFSSNDELIAFMEQVNKQFTIAGTSQEGQAAAMLQLTQAMGAGVLRGEELNSIFENAPTMIQSIADYLNKPIGEIREMASEGQITADIVKNAMFTAADETNKKFESMPMTFGQVMQSVKNQALVAFQPVFNQLSQLANSPQFASMVDGIVAGLSTVAGVVVQIFSVVASVGGFIADNWSLIAPIVGMAAVALGIYTGALIINNVQQGISNTLKRIAAVQAVAHGTATAAETAATVGMTTAQLSFNAALYACPLTWILLLIIAVIAAIYIVIAVINKVQNKTISATGVICGSINVVIQFFKNLGLTVANIALAIWNAMKATAGNVQTAFHNAIASVQSWWYDLLSTSLEVIDGICKALNKLPFVDFDYSGISNAADSYAAKSAAAAGRKEDYQSISDAFSKGMNTFDTFGKGWVSDAYNSGYNWGKGKADTAKNKFEGMMNGKASSLGNSRATGSGGAGNIGKGVGNIDKNTKKINDAVQSSSEDLKLIRQLAERAAINKITTTNVKVDMTGMTNQINDKDRDIDGFINTFTKKVEEAFLSSAEGVHE